MSRKGDCWDNAVTETLFGSLKIERLHEMRFATRRQAKNEVIDWLGFYNLEGFIRPWAISALWLSRKSGLPTKKGLRHNRSALGDAKRGQGHPPAGEKANIPWTPLQTS